MRLWRWHGVRSGTWKSMGRHKKSFCDVNDAPTRLDRRLADAAPSFRCESAPVCAGPLAIAVRPDFDTPGAQFVRNLQEFKQLRMQRRLAADHGHGGRPVELRACRTNSRASSIVMSGVVGGKKHSRLQFVQARSHRYVMCHSAKLLLGTLSGGIRSQFVTAPLGIAVPHVTRNAAHLAQMKEVVRGVMSDFRIGQDAQAARAPPGAGGFFVVAEETAHIKRPNTISKAQCATGPGCRHTTRQPRDR